MDSSAAGSGEHSDDVLSQGVQRKGQGKAAASRHKQHKGGSKETDAAAGSSQQHVDKSAKAGDTADNGKQQAKKRTTEDALSAGVEQPKQKKTKAPPAAGKASAKSTLEAVTGSRKSKEAFKVEAMRNATTLSMLERNISCHSGPYSSTVFT